MAKCINDLISASKGAITKKEAEEIIKAIERQFNRKMPKEVLRTREQRMDAEGNKTPEQRMIDAAEEAFKERVTEKKEKARRRELQVEAQARLQYQLASTVKEGAYNTALRDLINTRVAGRVKAITEDYLATLYRGIEPFLSLTGFKKLTEEQALEIATVMMDDQRVKSLSSKGVEDLTEMEYLAVQYRLASDRAFQRANDAGADIKYLRGRLPQSWDSRSVRFYGLDVRDQATLANPAAKQLTRARIGAKAMHRWVDFVMPLVDREKYSDPETGRPLGDEDVRQMLQSVWQTLATGGLSKEPAGLLDANAKGAALAEKLGAHRELHFKDPDSFMAANKEFGSGDIFTAMVGDLRRKAQGTALMETFGPDAETGYKTISAWSKSQQAQATMDGRHGSTINDLMFDELMGKTAGATEERFDLVNRFMQGVRNYLTAGKMGMLLLSQVNDVATFYAIARTDGLGIGRAVKIAGEFLNPLNRADREIARKHAILAQSVINDVALRYGAEQTQTMSRKLANWTVTLSGAEHWTNAMKMGFQTLVASHAADYRGKAYPDLDPTYRHMLQRHGIEAADWDIIRQAETVDLAGVQIISPYSVARLVTDAAADMSGGKKNRQAQAAAQAATREAATKYGAMLAEEADTGMLTPDVRTQAIIHQSTKPGTLWGEFARSAMLFKTFSVAILTRALPRIFAEGVGYSRASVATQWALGMIVGGAISTQLKELARGRNPRDMSDWRFWAAAALQSGGLGILGDFALSDANRFGQSLATSIGGPVVGFADDLKKLTVGNIQQALAGENTHATAEAIQFGKNYAPLMNLWYTRLALDHLLFYHVQEAANPGYLRRMRRNVENKNQQTWWWAPDENAPDVPDLAQAFGGRR